MGYIPVSEIRRYVGRFGFTTSVQDKLVQVLRAMDGKYLEHIEHEREKERNEEEARRRSLRKHG